ncbi:MAG: hypothetical protein Q9182_001163 [Xanthomendoza sp. 2 TL-2023]
MAGQGPPTNTSVVQTDAEERNIAVVKEYMRIANSPTGNKGRSSVAHLCTEDSVFEAPTTFPGCETPLDYADSHSKVMSAISDLEITSFDIVFAKEGHVLLRYSAEGSHCGQPHNGIQATGNRAKWHAAAIFEVRDGKIYSFTKEWDKVRLSNDHVLYFTQSQPGN